MKFHVTTLDGETAGEVEIFDFTSFSFNEIQNVKSVGGSGFYTRNAGSVSFIVAKDRVSIDGIDLPDWGGKKFIGIDGQLVDDALLEKVALLDLMIFRRFQSWSYGKCVVKKWYIPHWKDWLFPADPLMPWGLDFYAYLYFRLSSSPHGARTSEPKRADP